MSWPEIDVYAHDQRTHPETACCTAAKNILCSLYSVALHTDSVHALKPQTSGFLIIILSPTVLFGG